MRSVLKFSSFLTRFFAGKNTNLDRLRALIYISQIKLAIRPVIPSRR